jgi:hypothetical protein
MATGQACPHTAECTTHTNDGIHQSFECSLGPYTPISTNADIGYFDLLIKDYPDHKAMSQFLTETILPGDQVAFKHIEFNVKMKLPNWTR